MLYGCGLQARASDSQHHAVARLGCLRVRECRLEELLADSVERTSDFRKEITRLELEFAIRGPSAAPVKPPSIRRASPFKQPSIGNGYPRVMNFRHVAFGRDLEGRNSARSSMQRRMSVLPRGGS